MNNKKMFLICGGVILAIILAASIYLATISGGDNRGNVGLLNPNPIETPSLGTEAERQAENEQKEVQPPSLFDEILLEAIEYLNYGDFDAADAYLAEKQSTTQKTEDPNDLYNSIQSVRREIGLVETLQGYHYRDEETAKAFRDFVHPELMAVAFAYCPLSTKLYVCDSDDSIAFPPQPKDVSLNISEIHYTLEEFREKFDPNDGRTEEAVLEAYEAFRFIYVEYYGLPCELTVRLYESRYRPVQLTTVDRKYDGATIALNELRVLKTQNVDPTYIDRMVHYSVMDVEKLDWELEEIAKNGEFFTPIPLPDPTPE